MPLRPSKILALAALALVSAGCPKPPPPPPPPPPVVEAPPAPAKCESISEHCESKPDTRVKIVNSSLAFTPATGWVYAMQSSSSVAQASDSGPAIAFLGIDVDPKDAKKEISAKDVALAELIRQLGVSPLKRKVSWKKPDDKKSIGVYRVEFWQLEEAVRGAKKGPLLVVCAPTNDGKSVIGVGFVPDDDTTKADAAILKSIESLGPGK